MLTARSTLATHSMRSLATIRRLGTDDPRMSQIVVHNGIVHTCGQTDAEGKTVEEQTRACLAKVDALLARAGTDKSQLLTASIWLKHIEQDFAAMNGVWNAWLDPANKPVRFCVEVRGHLPTSTGHSGFTFTKRTRQANLARPHLLVEVQVTAAAAEDIPDDAR